MREYKIRLQDDHNITDLGPSYLVYYEVAQQPHDEDIPAIPEEIKLKNSRTVYKHKSQQPEGTVIIGTILVAKTGRFAGKYIAHAGWNPPTCFMQGCSTMEEAIVWLAKSAGDFR